MWVYISYGCNFPNIVWHVSDQWQNLPFHFGNHDNNIVPSVSRDMFEIWKKSLHMEKHYHYFSKSCPYHFKLIWNHPRKFIHSTLIMWVSYRIFPIFQINRHNCGQHKCLYRMTPLQVFFHSAKFKSSMAIICEDIARKPWLSATVLLLWRHHFTHLHKGKSWISREPMK